MGYCWLKTISTPGRGDQAAPLALMGGVPYELRNVVDIQTPRHARHSDTKQQSSGYIAGESLRFECLLTPTGAGGRNFIVVSFDIDGDPAAITTSANARAPEVEGSGGEVSIAAFGADEDSITLKSRSATFPASHDSDERPLKRRRATGGLRIGSTQQDATAVLAVTRRLESGHRVFPQRKKRPPENPTFQPSTLDKFINGVWDSIHSGVRLDPTEVIEQWQAVEASGQPKLLQDAENEVSEELTEFARMNILARKISQTSKTCRALEVIVQTRWIQCFDDRVSELTAQMPREKAKKLCVGQACADFNWSEKELRNKMAIWRGYHDVQKSGGWAASVFAGMGLYRFCKYRVAFTEEAFQSLRALRHRFEVAADTLHPPWRQLLAIINERSQRLHTGHPHDWVVCGPRDEALPLSQTYRHWDSDFSFVYLRNSVVDEDA